LQVAAMHVEHKTKTSVRELRVHRLYAQESADKQLYFDMGILMTDHPLGAPIALGSPTELGELDNGEPLVCLAIDHTGDPIDRFQVLAPQAYQGKIFAITSLPPQPGGPRLLHLRGTFSPKASGSPIVNRQGHLIAVYCEPAGNADKKPNDLVVSYAKVIEPDSIALAAQRSDTTIWVRPVADSTSPSPQGAPK